MTTISNTFSDWQARLKQQVDRVLEQKWFNLGLRAKMGTLVTTGLIGLVTIFTVLGISSARQATQQVLRERVTLARLSAKSLDNTLLHIQNTLSILASLPALQDPKASFGERQQALNNILIADKGIHLLDQQGHELASSEKGPHTPVDWHNSTAVQEALQGKPFNLSVVIMEQPWAIIATPVFNSASSHPVAALAVALDLSSLDPFLLEHTFRLGKTSTLDVVDANGLILFSSDSSRVMTTIENDSVRERLFSIVESGAETCLGCTGDQLSEPIDEAIDEVIAFSPLLKTDWGVIIRQEAREVFTPVRRLMIQNLILGSLAIIGALLMVWVTTNSVITPVQSLTNAARRIAEGDLATPIDILNESWPFNRNRRRDEIGALAESFSTMRDRLEKSMAEIQTWNQELDQRVQIRTRQALEAQIHAQAARDDLRAIIDALSDELIVIGVNNRRIYLSNKAAQRRNGGAVKLEGLNCYQVLHQGQPCEPPACECPVPAVLEGGKSVKVTHVRNRGANNHERYLDVVASPMYDAQGKITRIVELTRDVTEEKKTKDSLVRKNQELAILNAVANTVNQSLDLEIILGHALDQVLHLTGIDVGAIFLLNENLGSLDLLAIRGLSEETARLASQTGLLDGACGGVVERGEIVVIPDIRKYRGRRAKSLKSEKLRTLIHVPLMSKGCALGSMCVATRHKRDFDSDEEELLTAIGSQIAVAIENARLYTEVQHKERIRGELFKKAITAQEEERKRIARELHDDTSQSLTALLYAIEESTEMVSLNKVKKRLVTMQELTQRTLDGIHKLIFDLRPSMLDHLGLIPALRWFAQSHLEPKGVRVTVHESPPALRLPAEVETALFRVIQEAITNIARHAAARNVTISLDRSENNVIVEVNDDGIGFDIGQIALLPNSPQGLGLLGMEERLELLGGELNINTMPGQGTSLHISVPLSERSVTYA